MNNKVQEGRKVKARIWFHGEYETIEKLTWICDVCNAEYLARTKALNCNHTESEGQLNTGFYQIGEK